MSDAEIIAAAIEWEAARTSALLISESTGGRSTDFDHLVRLGNAENVLKQVVRKRNAQ